MTEPTVGRVVLFRPANYDTDTACESGGRVPALVTRVHSSRLVNIGGFDANGKPFAKTSVTLLQDGDAPLPDGFFCEWPKRDAKAEQVEVVAAAARRGADLVGDVVR